MIFLLILIAALLCNLAYLWYTHLMEQLLSIFDEPILFFESDSLKFDSIKNPSNSE
jgi:hypothetical protein